MPSVLRQVQEEWNALVPAAQARGLRRVNIIPATRLEAIADRRAKLEWLRAQLSITGSFDGLSFGVEIECIRPPGMSLSRLAQLVAAGGVPCSEQRYGHSVPTGSWKVVTDASVGYERGAEVVSPPLRGDAGFDQLQKVMKALTDAGCKVSKKCGFHVHVGVASEGVQFFKNLAVLYASAERAIDSFMAPSRRGSQNSYIQPVRVVPAAMAAAQTVDDVARACGQDPGAANVRNHKRYRKLNLQSFWAYSTVEFRHHQGTVDGEKATNWVKLCLRMVLASRAGEKAVATVDELLTAVEATDAEKAYFRGRVAYFGRGSENFSSYADRVMRTGRGRNW